MEHRSATGAADVALLDQAQLRERFVVAGLFRPAEIRLCHWEAERTVLGTAVPGPEPLALGAPPLLRAASLLERRELGVINLGGPGTITAGGDRFHLDRHDGLYLGRGAGEVGFASDDPRHPARYYMISYPAHAQHPSVLIRSHEAARLELGQAEEANRRTIHKYIHSDFVPSCQLTMGITRLQAGSVWNTMPPHTHSRRTEVYLYTELGAEDMVVHLMGEPGAIRHLLLRNDEAVLSPAWSIHCGAGTRAYAFVWAMGGENRDFGDMDRAPVSSLR